MREIVHLQAGQCGNQIGAKVRRCTTIHSTCTRLSCGFVQSASSIFSLDEINRASPINNSNFTGAHTFVSARLNSTSVSFFLSAPDFFIIRKLICFFLLKCFFLSNKFFKVHLIFPRAARFAMLEGKLIVKSIRRREGIYWPPIPPLGLHQISGDSSRPAFSLAAPEMNFRLFYLSTMPNREWKENFYGNSRVKKMI